MEQLNPREILISLGLAGLDPEAAADVLRSFFAVVELRVGKRITTAMGPRWQSDFESTVDMNSDSPYNLRKGLSYLEATVPGYEQYVREELERTMQEFIERLSAEVSGKLS